LKYPFLFIFTLLYLGSIHAASANDSWPEPGMLLDEMSQSSRVLNYDGIFIYRHNKQIDTMRIIHKSSNAGVYERLISLTGNAREIIRDQEQVKCYFPETKTVVVDKSRLGKLISTYLPSPVKSISEYYDFEIAGEDRIADRETWIVNIRPKDKYRYGYQIWIGKKSRLLLKSEVKNQLGVTLEQIMFTQLNVLDDIDDVLLQPSMSTEDFIWYNNVKNVSFKIDNAKKWKVSSMPAGFMMSEQQKKSMMNSVEPIEHFVYTDGLATVSIYVEKLISQPDMKVGIFSFGGVNTYSTHTEGYQITAVGEVPKATVKLMASSVKSYH